MLGHRLMGVTLTIRRTSRQLGSISIARMHFMIPLRIGPLATRFGQDPGVTVLIIGRWVCCILGYPEAALVDANHALKDAREIGQAATLLYALNFIPLIHFHCGNYAAVNAQLQEGAALAEEKGAFLWKMHRILIQSWISALNCKASDAVQVLISGIAGWRSTGSTVFMPMSLSFLARAHANIGQFDEARRCISEALLTIGTTKEKWQEAEINRLAGEIAFMSASRMRRKRKRISSAR